LSELFQSVIDLTTGFSTFYEDQLAKIYQYGWKERLKISKAVKFEGDLFEKTNEE